MFIAPKLDYKLSKVLIQSNLMKIIDYANGVSFKMQNKNINIWELIF